METINLRYILLAFFIAFLISIIYFFLYSDYNSIKKINIIGVQADITQKIYANLNKQLLKRRFLIFKQNNVYTFDKIRAKKEINNIIAYKNININISDNILFVDILEKDGVINWSNIYGTYLIDSNGVAVRNLPEFKPITESVSSDKNIYKISLMVIPDDRPLIYDNSNKKIEINTKSLPKELIDKITLLHQLLKKQNFTITSYEIDNISSYEITANTIENWKIFIDLNNDIEKEILRLKLLLETKFPENQRTDLYYIDLRNQEKIFYR